MNGASYPGRFHTAATWAMAEVGSEMGKFFLQARYDKVIKYNHRPPTGIAVRWTEAPYMVVAVWKYLSKIKNKTGKPIFRCRPVRNFNR